MLFVNRDHDPIFPMDVNRRLVNRLERRYRLFLADDDVDSLVSIGGHDYRKDIRQAAYRFINTYPRDDPQPVSDSEVDLVTKHFQNLWHPIACQNLRVFTDDSVIPEDQINTMIDEHFVPLAQVKIPKPGEFDRWKRKIVDELHHVSLQRLPSRVPMA